ncbi:MAG: diguanylate cyclase, partial [Cyanobacteria bacterium J06555_13]
MQVTTVDGIEQARSIIFPEIDAASTPQMPNIVVFDFDGSKHLPDNDSPEFKLLARLQQAQPPISTIILTAAASFENRVRVARLGVAGLLQTPVTPTEVLEAATRVLQKGAPPTAKLLVVDDDPAMLALLENILQPWGFRLKFLSNPQDFWQVLERFEPDLVLLDVQMPDISGFDLCQVIRNAPRWQETPVLFMSAYTDEDTVQQVFSVGADDYIRKPIVAPELVARVLGWLARSRTRQLRADVDSLTGIANRQKSTQLITRMMGLAKRQGETLCFAVVDFDHFKQVNDQYGHPVGDRVLRRFGECLRETFRAEDVIGRWGGEEFVVGLYGMSRQEGTQRLRQFLKDWQQEAFPCFSSIASDRDTDSIDNNKAEQKRPEDTSTFKMTFTAGVAVYPHDGTDLQGLYRSADQALYKAKAAGRNQILAAE